MQKSCQRHSTLHLFMAIFLLSSIYYALGNLYKLEPSSNIWHEDILETFNIKSKIQCASICNQKNGCIGFGISSDRCFLLKSLAIQDTCEESCLDLPEIKIYVQNNFKITSTMTQIKSTTESSVTVKTESTITTTSESQTTSTDLPTTTNLPASTTKESHTVQTESSATTNSPASTTKESHTVETESSAKRTIESDTTTTTESATITTTESARTTSESPTTNTLAPWPPPVTCGCDQPNGYFNGMRAYTKFYQDGAMIVDCQCMRNTYLYNGYRHEPTDIPVKPGTLTRCLGKKTSGIVGMYINYDMSGTKLYDYLIRCGEFYDGIVDTNKEIIVKSSAPENKEVRCDDYQVIFGYQAIEQEDGSYDVRLECQPLIPR